MEFYKIIVESLAYPLYNWKKLIELGILILMPLIIFVFLVVLGNGNEIITLIASILLFLVYTFILGYFTRTLNANIHDRSMPEFNYMIDIYEGFRLIALLLFYFFIPIIILSLILLITGYVDDFVRFGHYISVFVLGILNSDFLLDAVFDYIFNPSSPLAWISIILIVFSSLFTIGLGRYADDFNLIRGVDLGSIINTIGVLSWDFVLWFVFSFLIIFIISYVCSHIFNNFFTVLIFLLFIQPYIILFVSKSIALIYRNFKNQNLLKVKLK